MTGMRRGLFVICGVMCAQLLFGCAGKRELTPEEAEMKRKVETGTMASYFSVLPIREFENCLKRNGVPNDELTANKNTNTFSIRTFLDKEDFQIKALDINARPTNPKLAPVFEKCLNTLAKDFTRPAMNGESQVKFTNTMVVAEGKLLPIRDVDARCQNPNFKLHLPELKDR